MKNRKIVIVTKDNASGLSRDTAILTAVLRQAGFQVTIFPVSKPTLGHKLHRIGETAQGKFWRAWGRFSYDIGIFLEAVVPYWLDYSKINCLMPNQEWFIDRWLPYLPHFDYVLCKTRYAQGIFAGLGCQTQFVSFTSVDRLPTAHLDPTKTYDSFFHLVGNISLQKGTAQVVDQWQRHPHWPPLHIRQPPQPYHQPAPNLHYLTDFLPDAQLQAYQNRHGLHLCPSEAEGFGHNLVEAMGCGALVLTTNGPPMNEIVTADRGLLMDYHETKPQNLGTNYYVTGEGLERAIEAVLALDEGERRRRGSAARAWYRDNDRFFRHTLVEFLRGL
ncbi:glycosyltransferase [Prochlorothrix hollandica]|uniref:Group 1 glycosyl transferase n=1 Tax=Prochlorothrix hollandica PCC 9006 = CALU 1027 TaxID=317619 RepID=A0A0M2PW21_PROHO|nr:glycosyltransferase [Prochlorothrix hollandica]KKI98571.1 group 1 glycosyl transferase [Prochlorothrix hollandica PCC 9006 = CALU 1027]